MTMAIRVYQENRTQSELFTLKILAQILFTQRHLWKRKKNDSEVVPFSILDVK